MSGLVDLEMVWEARRDLLREAEWWRLVREMRAGRSSKLAGGSSGGSPSGGSNVETVVRWGLEEDEPAVARLLELNGMPRWVALEGRFVLAERGGEVVGALRYRTEPKLMLLGLLVVDPLVEERETSVALYEGARKLAGELGVPQIWARAVRGGDYLYEAGYRFAAGAWWLDVARPAERRAELPAGGWRRVVALLGASSVAPFFRAFGDSR